MLRPMGEAFLLTASQQQRNRVAEVAAVSHVAGNVSGEAEDNHIQTDDMNVCVLRNVLQHGFRESAKPAVEAAAINSG